MALVPGLVRTIWCISTPAGVQAFLEAPEPMLEWGLGGASLQLAQGLHRKNKPCRKKKKTKKKEKVLLFLKSSFPIADLYLCWTGLCSPSAATLVVASLGKAL